MEGGGWGAFVTICHFSGYSPILEPLLPPSHATPSADFRALQPPPPHPLFLERTPVPTSVDPIVTGSRQIRPLSLLALPELPGRRTGLIYRSQSLGFLLGPS